MIRACALLAFAAVTLASPAAASGGCFILGLDHTGQGMDPTASPTSSPGCQFHEYHEGTVVTVTARPSNGWEVGAWSGTDDDTSTDLTNTITMPADLHFVTSEYVPICLSLTLGHSGLGADPVAVALGDGSVWTHHHVATQCDALGLAAADVDGDGDLDGIGGLSDVSNKIVWWKNQAGDATSWSIQDVADGLGWPISVDSADFDGDGSSDVVAAMLTDGRVVWWRNVNGDGSAWSSTIVANPVHGARDVVAVDMDEDGDPDIAGASRDSDRILWWENMDSGSTWVEHEVALGFDGANSVAPADYDGDGDLDLAGAAQNADQVAWFENLDGAGTSWATHILQSGNFDFALEVVSADLNGDGEPDIMATALTDDLVRWWENLGGASAFLARDVTNLDRVSAARAADLNLDGRQDVVAQAQEILSWRNRDGTGTSWARVTVADPYINTGDLITADFDGDGDTDVMASQEVPCGVDVWRNTYATTCPGAELEPKDRLRVEAEPEPGWRVAGWSGTLDDASTELVNFVQMPLVDHTVLVHYEEIDPFEFSLSVAGACPGLVSMTIAGASADAPVAMLAGLEGSETLAGGPCAGTEVDLRSSRVIVSGTADASGNLELDRTLGAGFCGRFLQALDTATCGVSNTVEVP